MASTTNYGWSTPDDSAYVKDGASAIRTLGSAIDTSVKSLNAGTTAGDLDYYTSATAKTRIPIGAAGQVLLVSGGVPAWGTSSGFDPMLSTKIAGQYIKNVVATTSFTATANTTYYSPIFLPAFTADRIGFRTAAGTLLASGLTRLGIYNCNLTTGKPTTVLLDAGTVNTTGASSDFQITISQSISAGWYFMAFNTVSTWQPTAANASASLPFYNVVSDTLGGVPLSSFRETGITGAFATAGTLISSSNQSPMVGLRVA
jgi:hypothetical protein